MKRRVCPRIVRLGALVWALTSALPAARAQEEEAEGAEAIGATADPTPATEQARAHFQRGVDYYTEGDLAAALVEFERAYALQPAYRLLYNLGQVTYELRDYAAAERYFRRYLAEGRAEIDPARRAEVEDELGRLKGRVSDVTLRSNRPDAAIFVDDHQVGRTPLGAPVRVSAGRREIRAELPGYPPVIRKVDVVGAEPLVVQLDFAGPMAAPSEGEAARATSSSTSPALWTGIATAAFGLGAAGMALWTDSDQRTYDETLDKMTTRDELDSLSERVETKALVTDILLGATIVTGAITIVLLLTGDGGEDESPDEATVRVGAGSLHVAF